MRACDAEYFIAYVAAVEARIQRSARAVNRRCGRAPSILFARERRRRRERSRGRAHPMTTRRVVTSKTTRAIGARRAVALEPRRRALTVARAGARPPRDVRRDGVASVGAVSARPRASEVRYRVMVHRVISCGVRRSRARARRRDRPDVTLARGSFFVASTVHVQTCGDEYCGYCYI